MRSTPLPFARSRTGVAVIGRLAFIVEFAPDGTFLSANDLYCEFVGRDRASLIGKPHSVVVDAEQANSASYKEFLAKLARGDDFAQESCRTDKHGHQVWARACYGAVRDQRGKVRKIIGLGIDITSSKLQAAENAAKWDAIRRAQAVVEFAPDGQIVGANENFLDLMGYRLEEILGKHYTMSLEPAYAQSDTYRENWRRLSSGEFMTGVFKRIGKGGKEIWLEEFGQFGLRPRTARREDRSGRR